MNKATIMFVDDEKHILNAMKWLFRNDYHLLFANSGEEAVELMKTNSIDVLISDQKMPGMRGTEVLKAAREHCPNTLRLLLTGYSDYNAVVASINEGEVFRFIQKPWNNAKLKTSIAEAVQVALTGAGAEPKAVKPKVATETNAPTKPRAGILSILSSAPASEALKTKLPGGYTQYHAKSLTEAIELLGIKDIGVMVIEHNMESKQITDFIMVMKKHHPQILTLVICDIEDITDVIGLINSGQVYRFLKPSVGAAALNMAIESAYRQHAVLKERPHLKSRYTVDMSQFEDKLSSTSNDIKQVKTGQEFSFMDLFRKIKNLGSKA